MIAKIYQPSKNAMQSGMGRTKLWVLEHPPQEKKSKDPLMGYTSSSDMLAQVKLRFDTKAGAIAYAQKNNLAFQLVEPHKRKHRPRSYSDNFKYGRIGSWTH